MNALAKVFLTLLTVSYFAAGCAGAEDKVRQTTQPVGAVTGVVQAVPEGVAQGYAHDNSPNPYGR